MKSTLGFCLRKLEIWPRSAFHDTKFYDTDNISFEFSACIQLKCYFFNKYFTPHSFSILMSLNSHFKLHFFIKDPYISQRQKHTGKKMDHD